MIDSELEFVDEPAAKRSAAPSTASATALATDVGQRPRKPLRGGARASISALTDAVVNAGLPKSATAGRATSASGSAASVAERPVTPTPTRVDASSQSRIPSNRSPLHAVSDAAMTAAMRDGAPGRSDTAKFATSPHWQADAVAARSHGRADAVAPRSHERADTVAAHTHKQADAVAVAARPRGQWFDKAVPLAILLLITTLGVWFITVGQRPGLAPASDALPVVSASPGSATPPTSLAASSEQTMQSAEQAARSPEETIPSAEQAIRPARQALQSAEQAPPSSMLADAGSEWRDDPELAREFEQLVNENRKLDATVEELEQETMDLEREMLELDLQIAAMSTDSPESSDPSELPSETSKVSATSPSSADESDPGTATPTHIEIEIDERPGMLGAVSNQPPSASLDDASDYVMDEIPDYASDDAMEDESEYAPDYALEDEPDYALDYTEEADESEWASDDFDADVRQPSAEDLLSDEPFLPDATLENFADAYGAADDVASLPPEIMSVEDDPGTARAEVSASLGLPVERLAIAEVPPGSLADRSLMTPGDLILAIDGLPLTSFDDLADHHAGVPNEIHDVEILRGTLRMHVTVVGSPLDLSLRAEWVDPAKLIE